MIDGAKSFAVDRISRLLGHGIRVRSEEGRGSMFSVIVDRQPAEGLEKGAVPGERIAGAL